MGLLSEVYYAALVIWRAFFIRGEFTTDKMPDLTGRVMVVTGGNAGIGWETIKALLEHNAKVYMASRSRSRAEAAIALLKEETDKEPIFLELDLANLKSVRRAAEELLSKEPELHVLFNSAGVNIPFKKQLTADGYDLDFGTNVIGHFLFTGMLMPSLIAGAESSPDRHARIITTSSSIAMLGHINFDSWKEGPARQRTAVDLLYAQSKLANVIVARQIARRYADKGIVSISVDPGNIVSDMQRYDRERTGISGVLTRIVFAIVLRPTPFGALTQLWAGTMPEAVHANGEYLIPIARTARCRLEAYDDEFGRKVWKRLEEEIKGR
ncbi:NAD-P-binding protein [Laetiporus sulphureus 93-53]|uniref:NAD-P-binding protein n=1 Tax=Laetiporus sulphureus 93-53 TaxID=1314785 RepID=A0A165HHL5_9APHY|nr:NAD-P-binding protein [Laetiporus sulphureus 93-53]KZT11743.1 NAD-P-binding protein [Laetiporus sulphureus 93-53]